MASRFVRVAAAFVACFVVMVAFAMWADNRCAECKRRERELRAEVAHSPTHSLTLSLIRPHKHTHAETQQVAQQTVHYSHAFDDSACDTGTTLTVLIAIQSGGPNQRDRRQLQRDTWITLLPQWERQLQMRIRHVFVVAGAARCTL